MVQVLNEVRHSGGYVVSEEVYFSRDQGLYVNTGTTDLVVVAGTVLASGAETDATALPRVGNSGTASISALSFGPAAVLGTYVVTLTSPTAFTITNPAGGSLPGGAAGTPYTNAGLNFTLSAGGIAGDSFNIVVPASDKNYVNWVNAAPAVAIMHNTVIIAANSTAKVAVTARRTEVNAAELIWDASIVASVNPSFVTLQQIGLQQLKAVGIIAR